MSLINDALRKARLEAARQDSSRRGVPLPTVPVRRSELSAAPVLRGLLVAALLLLVGAALYVAGRYSAGLASRPPADPDLVAAQPAPETAAPAPPPSSQPAPPQLAAPETPTPQAGSTTPPAVTPEPPAEAIGSPPTLAAEPAPAPPPRQPTATPRPAASPRPRTEPAGPAVFVSRAELPGDLTLELGGIAWSESRPFALINGTVLGPGDRIAGLTIVAIEPRQVELSGEVDGASRGLILQLK